MTSTLLLQALFHAMPWDRSEGPIESRQAGHCPEEAHSLLGDPQETRQCQWDMEGRGGAMGLQASGQHPRPGQNEFCRNKALD